MNQTFQCPGCNTWLEVKSTSSNTAIKCPSCAQLLRQPSAASRPIKPPSSENADWTTTKRSRKARGTDQESPFSIVLSSHTLLIRSCLVGLAVISTWRCYLSLPSASDQLGTLLIPAVLLLLASLSWTLHAQTGIPVPWGKVGVLVSRRPIWIVLLASGAAGTVPIFIASNQLIKGSSNALAYTLVVLVLCYTLALVMPINNALSQRNLRRLILHAATGIVGMLLLAVFVGLLFATNDGSGFCRSTAMLLQVAILLYMMTCLVAEWIIFADIADILKARLTFRLCDLPLDELRSVQLKVPRRLKRLPVDLHPKMRNPSDIVTAAWLVMVVGVALNLIVQFGAVFLMVRSVRPDRASLAEYETLVYELLMAPSTFFVMLILSQGSILAVVLVATWLSPIPMRHCLALLSVRWNALCWMMVLASCLFPIGMGMISSSFLGHFNPPDPLIGSVVRRLSFAEWCFFLIAISLLPGFAEELLFRGYFQNWLHFRLHPAWCVTLSGCLFGLVHIQPHAILFAMIVGLWLAYLTYCSGSVWPAICCHAVTNVLMTLLNFGAIYTNHDFQFLAAIIFACVGIGPFMVTLRWFNNTR